MRKSILCVALGLALLASLLIGCGKTDSEEQSEEVVRTTAAIVEISLEEYLADEATRTAVEEQFQLPAALAQYSDKFTAIHVSAEGNDIYIDYYFTPEFVLAEDEEAYKEAMAESIEGAKPDSYVGFAKATVEATGLIPDHIGCRYIAASGNELGRVTFTYDEIMAVAQE